ncbi:MAG: bifunctional DNA-formamidopyrimidine glycosylase/DNA-(apurinic or apyrimidinic site) lyase [Anaeromyxobacter sp.]|nr:bifunctional DNA-formamidopyrimidine glycosylase/DNA-(apurinic or apyrimidinic site) lyase [Anaeromyxobacter sp.]
MPELPEVEFAARTLRRLALGRRVARVLADERARRLFRPDGPDAVAAALTGARLAEVGRHGKQLLLTFEGRAGALGLVSHLGMTGKWEAGPPWAAAGAARSARALRRGAGEKPPRPASPRADAPLPPHVRLALLLDDGSALHYDDPRMFGRVRLVAGADFSAVEEVAALGPDPLHHGIDAAALGAGLSATRRPVKVALLDQGLLAGVGNIHAAEACWRARLDPRRRADRLSPAEVAALARGLRATFRFALSKLDGPEIEYIEAGGENPFHVYGREGARCRHPGCGGQVRRIVQAQRSTFFCPGCQG